MQHDQGHADLSLKQADGCFGIKAEITRVIAHKPSPRRAVGELREVAGFNGFQVLASDSGHLFSLVQGGPPGNARIAHALS